MSALGKQQPLRTRFASPDDRLRVLLLTNDDVDGDHPGQRDGFGRLVDERAIEAFTFAAPKVIAKTVGEQGALREILEIIRAKQPNVIVQITPQGFPFTREWFQELRGLAERPALLYWEGDAWGRRWTKPIHDEMRLWWQAADIVFSIALGPQRRLIERIGGRDVRFVPHTYDHIHCSEEEANEPTRSGVTDGVTVIANSWGNGFLPSRLPGARARYRFVRALQRDDGIPLSLYGRNWTGRGAKGPIGFGAQAAVARRALITANWDHFPRYPACTSDRLAIQMLAGRVHVTTRHPQMDWLPGPNTGLFLESSIAAAVDRIRELLQRPVEEVLDLGLAAHRWARHRLSDRELARYMLGAVDERLLRDLPPDPWDRLPA